MHKIYIVKGPGDTDGNLSEYICVKNSNNDYYFENVGKVQINGEINLDNYVDLTSPQQITGGKTFAYPFARR
mgnify:CR=1 FL=1